MICAGASSSHDGQEMCARRCALFNAVITMAVQVDFPKCSEVAAFRSAVESIGQRLAYVRQRVSVGG